MSKRLEQALGQFSSCNIDLLCFRPSLLHTHIHIYQTLTIFFCLSLISIHHKWPQQPCVNGYGKALHKHKLIFIASKVSIQPDSQHTLQNMIPENNVWPHHIEQAPNIKNCMQIESLNRYKMGKLEMGLHGKQQEDLCFLYTTFIKEKICLVFEKQFKREDKYPTVQ